MEYMSEITRMEHHLNDASAALADFAAALEKLQAAQIWIHELERYYGSEEWYDHRSADERGELPASLPRGVLSEDAIYNLLTDNRDLAIQMLENATQMLK